MRAITRARLKPKRCSIIFPAASFSTASPSLASRPQTRTERANRAPDLAKLESLHNLLTKSFRQRSAPDYWKPAIEEMSKRKWADSSKRSAVIAQKMGMMHVWDQWGRLTPLTVLKSESTIIQVNKYKNGGIVLEHGMGPVKWKNLTKSEFHRFYHAGVEPKHTRKGFEVTSDALLPVGWEVDVRHFRPGQYVDVQGITIGKGTQGVMKRWNFGGQPATHGVSLTHRSLGSTGTNTDPARVWKGKKMPGRLGNETVTIQRMLVYKLDIPRKLIFIKGTVPGYQGNYVRIQDAVRNPFDDTTRPPFPTYLPQPGSEKETELIVSFDGEGDPFAL